MGQCANGFIQHDATVVEDFLEFCRCFAASMRRKIGFSTHINGIQIGPVVKANGGETKFIRSRALQNAKCLPWVCVFERKLRPKSWLIIRLHSCVFGESLAQIVSQYLRSVSFACIGKGKSKPIIRIVASPVPSFGL